MRARMTRWDALWRGVALIAGIAATPTVTATEPLTIAVAANFQETAQQLARAFEQETGIRVRLSAASSGKLYTQIVNGAPFDVFLSADSERPAALEKEGGGVAGTRFTYATGRLVLWSNDLMLAGRDCKVVLLEGGFKKLAIANPQHAPYGTAAIAVLEKLGLWPAVRKQLVMGENIAQTLQFVSSASAEVGFVARAQLLSREVPKGACRWDVPEDMHARIEQQAILLARAKDNPAGSAFLRFLQSPAALRSIEEHGYGINTR